MAEDSSTSNRGGKAGSGAETGGNAPVLIRKYANRRLYDTARGSFVTLEDLRKMVSEGRPFVVIDVTTDRDITSSVLAQIIAEQEGRGEEVLSADVLRQLIGLYEKGLSKSFSAYLESAMAAFGDNREQMKSLSELGRQNMEAMQRSFAAMFGMAGATANRTDAGAGQNARSNKPDQAAEASAEAGRSDAPDEPDDGLTGEVETLKAQLRAMQD